MALETVQAAIIINEEGNKSGKKAFGESDVLVSDVEVADLLKIIISELEIIRMCMTKMSGLQELNSLNELSE